MLIAIKALGWSIFDVSSDISIVNDVIAICVCFVIAVPNAINPACCFVGSQIADRVEPAKFLLDTVATLNMRFSTFSQDLVT